jgi:hypothetical protein
MKKSIHVWALLAALIFGLALMGCPTDSNPPEPTAAEKAAATFKTDHATVLALTVDTVAIANKGVVQAALTAYDALEADAKALLTAEKTLLDSLSAKIAELETASANEAAKTALVTALGGSTKATVSGTTITLIADATLTATATIPTGITLAVPSAFILTVSDNLVVNGSATVNGTTIFEAGSEINGSGVIDVSSTGVVWNQNTGAAGTSIYGAEFTGKIVLVDGSKLYIGTGAVTDGTAVTGAAHYWLGTAVFNDTTANLSSGSLIDITSPATVEISKGSLIFTGATKARDLNISAGETLTVKGAFTVLGQLSLPATSALTVVSGGSVKGVTTGNAYITTTWDVAPAGTITGLKADGTFGTGITNISDAAAALVTGNMYKWKSDNTVWLKLSNGAD